MENWITSAISAWESSNTKMNPGASMEQIEEAEKALDFKFPEDFKQLYQIVDGSVHCEWQEHYFSFWSLARIVKETSEVNGPCFITICDYLMSCDYIGFYKNRNGVFKVENEFNLICQTFQEAVFLINTNSDLIY